MCSVCPPPPSGSMPPPRTCSARREPQPRSSTTFAGGLPSARRCWLTGWPSSTRRMHSDSSLTTAAVCAASGEPSRAVERCRAGREDDGAGGWRYGEAPYWLGTTDETVLGVEWTTDMQAARRCVVSSRKGRGAAPPPTQPTPTHSPTHPHTPTCSGRPSLSGSVPPIWSVRPGPRTTTPQRCSVAYLTLTVCCEQGVWGWGSGGSHEGREGAAEAVIVRWPQGPAGHTECGRSSRGRLMGATPCPRDSRPRNAHASTAHHSLAPSEAGVPCMQHPPAGSWAGAGRRARRTARAPAPQTGGLPCAAARCQR